MKAKKLSQGEAEEISRLAGEARGLIGAIEDAPAALKNYVDRAKRDALNREAADLAFQLGSLFGMLIVQRYGWQWIQLMDGNGGSAYCVVPTGAQFCCQVHHYLHTLLTTDKENNLLLLFNMLAGLPYADTEKDRYMMLS